MPASPAPLIDVLGLGAVAWDELLDVERFPGPDEKVRIKGRTHICGGLTGNALIAAARYGATCTYAGKLGVDAASEAVAERLSSEGIDLTHAIRAEGYRVVQSTIVVASQTGSRNVFSYSPGGTGAHETRPEAELIAGARVLLVDHHGVEGHLRAARIARAAGHSVVADIERDDQPHLEELWPLVDHLILSEKFARRFTGKTSAAAAARTLFTPERAVVVVTCGAEGCWYIDRSGAEPRHLPAYPVTARDTTGCGDVFHGVYAAALALGQDLETRLRAASAAGALRASTRSTPTRAEIDALLTPPVP